MEGLELIIEKLKKDNENYRQAWSESAGGIDSELNEEDRNVLIQICESITISSHEEFLRDPQKPMGGL